jgi:DinB family protein
MAIIPDTKNWTWVSERSCPECGFDPQRIEREQVAALLADNAREWATLLAEQADVQDRPRPDVWSPLEYGCHVRDVCRIFAERLDLMLTQDGPRFANWDQDETAVADRYNEQDPQAVAPDLLAAADTLAIGFSRVSGEQWTRTGSRSDGSHFTIESFSRYLLHDPVHHWYDVTGASAADLGQPADR